MASPAWRCQGQDAAGSRSPPGSHSRRSQRCSNGCQPSSRPEIDEAGSHHMTKPIRLAYNSNRTQGRAPRHSQGSRGQGWETRDSPTQQPPARWQRLKVPFKVTLVQPAREVGPRTPLPPLASQINLTARAAEASELLPLQKRK